MHALSRPGRQRQLRWACIFLLSLWAIFALSRLVWSLVPTPPLEERASVTIINPIQQSASAEGATEVDIQRMVSWHLFGEAGAQLPEELVPEVLVANDPFWVRNCPEKLLVLQFPELIPATMIARELADLRTFKDTHDDIILKPLYGNGGAGVHGLVRW